MWPLVGSWAKWYKDLLKVCTLSSLLLTCLEPQPIITAVQSQGVHQGFGLGPQLISHARWTAHTLWSSWAIWGRTQCWTENFLSAVSFGHTVKPLILIGLAQVGENANEKWAGFAWGRSSLLSFAENVSPSLGSSPLALLKSEWMTFQSSHQCASPDL